jgi:hypothetical protein
LFVLFYSKLPHKGFNKIKNIELRFIFYSIPVFNLISSIGVYNLWKKNFKALNLLIVFSFIFSYLLTLIFLYSSYLNYPGGFSLKKFNEKFSNQNNINIHMDSYATMVTIILI